MNPHNRFLAWLFGKVVPFLDFFLLEVFLAKRGVVALLVSAVACVGVWFLRPSLETLRIPLNVWGLPLELWVFVTLAVLLTVLSAVHRWFSYRRGPKNATYDVVFAGFYDPSGPEGNNFARSGASKSLEAEFLRTMRQALKWAPDKLGRAYSEYNREGRPTVESRGLPTPTGFPRGAGL